MLHFKDKVEDTSSVVEEVAEAVEAVEEEEEAVEKVEEEEEQSELFEYTIMRIIVTLTDTIFMRVILLRPATLRESDIVTMQP